jgi:hypothetical protein
VGELLWWAEEYWTKREEEVWLFVSRTVAERQGRSREGMSVKTEQVGVLALLIGRRMKTWLPPGVC